MLPPLPAPHLLSDDRVYILVYRRLREPLAYLLIYALSQHASIYRVIVLHERTCVLSFKYQFGLPEVHELLARRQALIWISESLTSRSVYHRGEICILLEDPNHEVLWLRVKADFAHVLSQRLLRLDFWRQVDETHDWHAQVMQ